MSSSKPKQLSVAATDMGRGSRVSSSMYSCFCAFFRTLVSTAGGTYGLDSLFGHVGDKTFGSYLVVVVAGRTVVGLYFAVVAEETVVAVG